MPLPQLGIFLLHLTKGELRQLVFLFNVPPGLCQRCQPFPAGCDVFSLGSQGAYITACLSFTVWFVFSLVVSGRRDVVPHKTSRRGSAFCFALGSPDGQLCPSLAACFSPRLCVT